MAFEAKICDIYWFLTQWSKMLWIQWIYLFLHLFTYALPALGHRDWELHRKCIQFSTYLHCFLTKLSNAMVGPRKPYPCLHSSFKSKMEQVCTKIRTFIPVPNGAICLFLELRKVSKSLCVPDESWRCSWKQRTDKKNAENQGEQHSM